MNDTVKKPFSWSYTHLSQFSNCPLAYKYNYLDKVWPFTENAATKRGVTVHKSIEDHLIKGTPLPEDLLWLRRILDKFDGWNITAEQRVALDVSMAPVTYFAKTAWCRSVYDLRAEKDGVVALLDWKTGKMRDDTGQLRLFAGVEFASNPETHTVKTAYVWLDHKDMSTGVFTREKDNHPIWHEFLTKVHKVQTAIEQDKFPAKPSGLCGWCPASQAQCKHAKG
jgi:hypothetical protein